MFERDKGKQKNGASQKNSSRVKAKVRIDTAENEEPENLTGKVSNCSVPTMAAPPHASARPPTEDVDEIIQLLIKDGKRETREEACTERVSKNRESNEA